jgi:hypothetical protein
MRIITLAVLGTLVACGSSATPRAYHLEGQWSASFTLDSAWRLVREPQARELSGAITLSAAPQTAADAAPEKHVHSGTVAVDFGPFGFALARNGVIAWPLGADSVRMILDPTVDHGHVALDGTLKGERIEGRWQLISDPGGARGAFVLERQ